MDIEQLKIDVDFMMQALKEAQAAADEGEVPVGCVIVAEESGPARGKAKKSACTVGKGTGRGSANAAEVGIERTAGVGAGAGRVIARGHNLIQMLKDPTAHAEMQAITAASAHLGGKYLDRCTLYVTVEPCPMCAAALSWAQIGRVVYGCKDPKRGASKFTPSLYHPKTEVVGGVLEKECQEMMTSFFKTKR